MFLHVPVGCVVDVSEMLAVLIFKAKQHPH